MIFIEMTTSYIYNRKQTTKYEVKENDNQHV